MKRILLIAAMLLFTTRVQAEDPKPKVNPGFGGPSSDLVHDASIRKLYAQFTQAWNKHEPKAMAKMYMIDGDHMEPDGHHAKGHQEVEKLFTEEHKTVFKDSKLTLAIETVWFITETNAMVDGSYELTGVKDLEGKDVPARKGHLTSILLKEGDAWEIAASRAMIPVSLAYRGN